MSTTHSPQSQHQPRTGVQPAHALRAAIRGLRTLHDEQMLMWQAFFRTQVRPGKSARPTAACTAAVGLTAPALAVEAPAYTVPAIDSYAVAAPRGVPMATCRYPHAARKRLGSASAIEHRQGAITCTHGSYG